MIDVKAFLQQECDNIQRQLTDALRHDYGREGSKDFYEECLVRLDHVKVSLGSTQPTELAKLSALQADLSHLSGLISRIERSAYSDFSWPFAEELKGLALELCTENTLFGNLPPAIHILSEGGLATYAIWHERNRPSGARRKILTIVFPTTLKHSVLLHPILGHEVGHAIASVPKHQATLIGILNQTLAAGGPMQGAAAADAWLFDNSAPQEVKDYIAANSLAQPWCTDEIFLSWIEEFLCDFVGLVLFGPSFIAAQIALLSAMAPDGALFGLSHPPVIARLNTSLSAATLLGIDQTGNLGGAAKTAADAFWAAAHGKKSNNVWADVFTNQQLQTLLHGLQQFIGGFPGAAYPTPTNEFESLLTSLSNGIPPVGTVVTDAGEVKSKRVDFRHILYAGWLANEQQGATNNFHAINRLCDLAILQQRALKQFGAV